MAQSPPVAPHNLWTSGRKAHATTDREWLEKWNWPWYAHHEKASLIELPVLCPFSSVLWLPHPSSAAIYTYSSDCLSWQHAEGTVMYINPGLQSTVSVLKNIVSQSTLDLISWKILLKTCCPKCLIRLRCDTIRWWTERSDSHRFRPYLNTDPLVKLLTFYIGFYDLKGLWHGQKWLHLFLDSEAYYEQMGPIPSSYESLDIALSNAHT